MKGLLHGLLLRTEMPGNTELSPVSVGSGLRIYCRRVTDPPGCQMVTDHWFYSRNKAVLWRLRETVCLICPESDSVLELRMAEKLWHLAHGLKFHSFLLLWPADYML